MIQQLELMLAKFLEFIMWYIMFDLKLCLAAFVIVMIILIIGFMLDPNILDQDK